jgi:hypothetical protein
MALSSGLPRLAVLENDARLDRVDRSLEPAAYAAHRLTEQQRERFAQEGYIVVENALQAAEAAELGRILDATHAAKRAEDAARPDPAHRDAMNRMAMFSAANGLWREPAVERLVRNVAVLPKVVDILGWNIALYHAHANLTPGPSADGLVIDGQGRATKQPKERPPPGQELTFGWHQAGLITQGVPGSNRTPWHPVEDPLDPLYIGKVP